MKFETFYLLPQKQKQTNNTFNYTKHLISHITTTQWRSEKTILITWKNKLQAQQIDELLWKYNRNTFIPYHLCTNSAHNTPSIIYWLQYYYHNNKK